MEYETTSHRFGLDIIRQNDVYLVLWNEIIHSIESISDRQLIDCFRTMPKKSKSLAASINKLLHLNLVASGWAAESYIFQEDEYHDDKRWRLDFAKKPFSIEVGFNHGEAIAWNLLKPVMASELNHVRKAITTEIGVVICVTEGMKRYGGFDGAVGEYEKIKRYLRPFNNFLTVPMVLVGLMPPRSFFMSQHKGKNNRKVGTIVEKPCPYYDAR